MKPGQTQEAVMLAGRTAESYCRQGWIYVGIIEATFCKEYTQLFLSFKEQAEATNRNLSHFLVCVENQLFPERPCLFRHPLSELDAVQ